MNFGDVDFRSFITINGITGPSGKVIGYDTGGNLQFLNRGSAGGGSTGATGPSSINSGGLNYTTIRTQILNGTLNASPGDLLTVNASSAISSRFSVEFLHFIVPAGYTNGNKTWKGTGKFWDADFVGNGDYSQVLSPKLYNGYFNFDQSFNKLYSFGDIVLDTLFEGISPTLWRCIDPDLLNGLSPDNNPFAWDRLPFSSGNGYTPNYSIIEWDWENSWLVYREDKNGNRYRLCKEVSDEIGASNAGRPPVYSFPWNNPNVFSNKIEESIVHITQCTGIFRDNLIQNKSYISINELRDPVEDTFGYTGMRYNHMEGSNFIGSTSGISRTSIWDNHLKNSEVPFIGGTLTLRKNEFLNSHLERINVENYFTMFNNYISGSTFSGITAGINANSKFTINSNNIIESEINDFYTPVNPISNYCSQDFSGNFIRNSNLVSSTFSGPTGTTGNFYGNYIQLSTIQNTSFAVTDVQSFNSNILIGSYLLNSDFSRSEFYNNYLFNTEIDTSVISNSGSNSYLNSFYNMNFSGVEGPENGRDISGVLFNGSGGGPFGYEFATNLPNSNFPEVYDGISSVRILSFANGAWTTMWDDGSPSPIFTPII